jgi:nitrate reductase gamma subunit
MSGEFRYIPQDTLTDVANLINPVLNAVTPFMPYLVVLVVLPGFARALLQWKMETTRPPFIDADTDRKLRSVPLSVGLWGLFIMHMILVSLPGMAQHMAASEGGRATLEILTMGFGWFSLFGFLNVIVRYVLEKDLRRKLGKLGLLDMAIIATVLMPALGIMLYAWSTVRWGSVWTGTVMWQSWIDAWTFDFSHTDAMAELPVFVKLHMIFGPFATAHVLYSRLLTHLLVPRPRLMRLGVLRGGHQEEVSAGEVAALMYGVTADKKGHKH